ncbi:nucleotidyl transferase AbiEii/AbiGii toxin family protein [Pseudomonas sp. CrR25]|nr:nucleotidyl transferase AbiEii/AbiGii toxin family protein [Pseudomonas sp. CrR25]
MPEQFFELPEQDQREALQFAAAQTSRPAHLLEKDLWVVWTLRALFTSTAGQNLTFKGGTSLSKAYKVIDRFSEDIDLSYDIRELIPELTGKADLPSTRGEARRWTDRVRRRLPDWIQQAINPVLQSALEQEGLDATLQITGEKLCLRYPALASGTGYIPPVITLEFGARSTGEPHAPHHVVCDMDGAIEGVVFPEADPIVMDIARTFWEKATATHVYCAQQRIRSERFARHWHDLAAISRSAHFDEIAANRHIADLVAIHKSWFFREKAADGSVVDYHAAARGNIQIVPDGAARAALEQDYAMMLDDGVMIGDARTFDQLMQECVMIQDRLNALTVSKERS